MLHASCFFFFYLFLEFSTAGKNWRDCGKSVFSWRESERIYVLCVCLILIECVVEEQSKCQALNYLTSMICFKSLKISCIKNSDSCLRLLVLQSIFRGLSLNYYFAKYQANNAGIDTSIIKNSLRVYTFIENNPLCELT